MEKADKAEVGERRLVSGLATLLPFTTYCQLRLVVNHKRLDLKYSKTCSVDCNFVVNLKTHFA